MFSHLVHIRGLREVHMNQISLTLTKLRAEIYILTFKDSKYMIVNCSLLLCDVHNVPGFENDLRSHFSLQVHLNKLECHEKVHFFL